MTTFEDRFQEKLEKYARNYRIEDLNDANDRTLLDIMIKTELMIEDFQAKIKDLMAEDILSSASDLKKLADLLRDATGTITTVQKTLAIDRKTRKDEESGSVIDYINSLKKAAADFVEERLTKVHCPTCNVMVGRFSPVHGHTSFLVSFQCSQCQKMIRVRRDEKDTMYDIKPSDREWRKKYRAEVVQAKKAKPGETDLLGLDDEPEILLNPVFIEEDKMSVSDKIQDDLELRTGDSVE
jgi:hypothetical protein